jgi:hypothetical protein
LERATSSLPAVRDFHSYAASGVHLLSVDLSGGVEEGLGRTALGAVALAGSLAVVEVEVIIELSRELLEKLVGAACETPERFDAILFHIVKTDGRDPFEGRAPPAVRAGIERRAGAVGRLRAALAALRGPPGAVIASCHSRLMCPL